MANKIAIKKETLDRLGANFQESRGITDKLTLEQMIEYAAQPPATGENVLANQIIDRTITELNAEDLKDVTEIGQYSFGYCNKIEKVILPDNITRIGKNAFYYCSELKEITIGKGITVIQSAAFSGCTNLTKVNVDDLSLWCEISFADIDGSPFYSGKVTLYIKNEAGTYEPIVEELMIPNTVTKIGKYAFAKLNTITSVIIPDSVQKLETNSFLRCEGLTRVIIGDGTTNIDSYAFTNCNNLTSVTIGNGIKVIGGYSLCIGSEDNKATVTLLGTTPPSLQNSVFRTNTLEKIIVPKGCGEAYKTATNWADFADYIEEAAE